MKYIRIFFTFLGYCTFICLVGAATFWYIGQKRAAAKAAANPESTIVFQDNTAPTTPAAVDKLREFAPISRAAAPDKLVDPAAKPVVRKKPVAAPKPVAKPAPKPIVATKPAPIAYATPTKAKPTAKVAPAKPAAKPAPARKKPASHPIDTELPPPTISFRVTDNTRPARAGSGIDYNQVTDLEKAAKRHVEAVKQFEKETESLRNPKVWESGLLKLITDTTNK